MGSGWTLQTQGYGKSFLMSVWSVQIQQTN